MFKNGKINGLWEEYHKNGQLKIIQYYIDGKKDGLRENFNQDGSLEKTETYKDGVKID